MKVILFLVASFFSFNLYANRSNDIQAILEKAGVLVKQDWTIRQSFGEDGEASYHAVKNKVSYTLRSNVLIIAFPVKLSSELEDVYIEQFCLPVIKALEGESLDDAALSDISQTFNAARYIPGRIQSIIINKNKIVGYVPPFGKRHFSCSVNLN